MSAGERPGRRGRGEESRAGPREPGAAEEGEQGALMEAQLEHGEGDGAGRKGRSFNRAYIPLYRP